MQDTLGLSEVRFWKILLCLAALYFCILESQLIVHVDPVTADDYFKARSLDLEVDFCQGLNVKFRSSLKYFTTVQCYAPIVISNVVEKDAFYEQLHLVQKKLLKGDTNVEVGSDNSFLGHVFLCDRNNIEKFVDFYNFHNLIGSTLFEQI